jgi:hypothetical protein
VLLKEKYVRRLKRNELVYRRRKQVMKLWMAVTSDIYELPIYIEDTAQKLADKLNITVGAVINAAKRNFNSKYNSYKIIKIEVTEDD